MNSSVFIEGSDYVGVISLVIVIVLILWILFQMYETYRADNHAIFIGQHAVRFSLLEVHEAENYLRKYKKHITASFYESAMIALRNRREWLYNI